MTNNNLTLKPIILPASNIATIKEALASSKVKFITKESALINQVIEEQEKVRLKLKTSQLWESVSTWFSSWFHGASTLILIIIAYIWLGWLTLRPVRGTRVVGGGVALLSQTKGSFASPAHQITESVTNSTWFISETGSQVWNSLTIDHLIVASMGVTMIMIMICSHLCMQDKLRRLLTSTDAFALNKKITHHSGEVRLIMTVLYEFKHWFLKQTTRRELTFQVATIPGSITSWYTVTQKQFHTSDLKGKLSRVMWNHKLTMRWGYLCLKSTDFPSLDSCHSLPAIIELSVSDLLDSLKSPLPWTWRSADPISITTLHVVDHNSSRLIYTYTKNH